MPSVIVPLYIYPAPSAWNPLYTAVAQYPKLTFLVIVNPASGPGATALPDSNYTREILRLNTHANIRTLGYVSTNYAIRDLTAVKADIQKYSSWRDAGLGLCGIFLDETPAQYDAASAAFLGEAQTEARSAAGLTAECLIVNNPGTIPDLRYLPGADVTVVFEGTYDTYQMYGLSHSVANVARHSSSGSDPSAKGRPDFAIILHSLPPHVASDMSAVRNLVGELALLAGVLFVTDLACAYYAAWSGSWGQVVAELGRGGELK